MTLEFPTLLVLLGTALMTVAIFAPKPHVVSAAVATTASAPAFHACEVPGTLAAHLEPAGQAEPSWPNLVEPGAAGLGSGVRRAMVEALAALREPWADEILQRAAREETDERVRAALERALGA